LEFKKTKNKRKRREEDEREKESYRTIFSAIHHKAHEITLVQHTKF
jgi:cation transport regulator ChaB